MGTALQSHRTVARVVRRALHGVLLLDKPLGLSSNDALQKAKWLVRAEKAGHTGTLDPLATGVLPLCFGAATKFSQLHLEADKTYEAVARLGAVTSTADAEGTVVRQRAVQVTSADVERVADLFRGVISQVPPMYSALKRDGKALYEYARAGVEVEREARTVSIRSLELSLQLEAQAGPDLHLRVCCSKGTYVRTLAEDIGEALGCGAHLVALRRVATGDFTISQCVTLAALEQMTEPQRVQCLLPAAALLGRHGRVTLGAEDAGRFLSGMRRRGAWPDAEQVAVYATEPEALLGTAQVRGGELIPGRLLSPIEISQVLDCASNPAGSY